MLVEIRRDERYPFLAVRPVIEGRTPTGEVVEMSGDDLADFEDISRKYAAWQRRLAEADAASFPGVVVLVSLP